MKKRVLLLAAIFGMSSFSFADEYRAPVEQTAVEESSEDSEDEGLYLGLAYTHLTQDIDHSGDTIVSEMDFSALSLQLGYKFNPYIAVEGRYAMTFGDPDVEGRLPVNNDAEVKVWAIYAKPMYPVAPEFDIYALLGYAGTEATGSFTIDGENRSFEVDESGFSWGAGAVYTITEEFSVFADYLMFHDESTTHFDKVVDSFNIGITYQF